MSRELLQRCLNRFIRVGYEGTLVDDLEEYLASEKQDQPEPVQDEEPVAWVIPGGVTKSKDLAEANGNSAKPLYLHPAPQRSFVRLSEEEMKACEPQLGIVKTPEGAKVDGLWIYDFARAIEDALEEKNK